MLILCHSGCSPLWFSFSLISRCSPLLPFPSLYFPVLPVFILSVFPFSSSFICLLLKLPLSTLARGKGSGQSPVCVINQSFLGETEADLFFLAGFRVCFLFLVVSPSFYFFPFLFHPLFPIASLLPPSAPYSYHLDSVVAKGVEAFSVTPRVQEHSAENPLWFPPSSMKSAVHCSPNPSS